MEKMREACWFELGEVKAGYQSYQELCLMGDLNTQVGGVKISGVVEDFGIEVVTEEEELMI